MRRLWAPWRAVYFSKKTRGCLFCRVLRERRDRVHFVLERSKRSFVLLNLYPYNNGHVMVVPNRHVRDFDRLTPFEREDLLSLFVRVKKRLEKLLRPAGFNAGINFGRAAGAGITGHLHLHLVPRWTGDTNFMPVLADTKLISESLEAVYTKYRSLAAVRGRKAR